MKIRGLVALALTSVIATGFSSYASAGAMVCPSASSNGITTRTWSFDSAEACGLGNGNASNEKIEALGGQFDLGAPDWDHQGGISDPNDVGGGDGSSWLDVSFITGGWGSKDFTANWTLGDGFWEIFGTAVFSVHVGNASQPDLADFGAFIITPGQYSGTWAFVQTPTDGKKGVGGGGALSNAHLWTSGTGTIEEDPFPVPEPGILMLFASGLLGLAFGNRRKAKA